MQAAHARWVSLSDNQRKAWAVASRQRPQPDRFGTPRTISGYQLFLTIPHDFSLFAGPLWQDIPPNQTFTQYDDAYPAFFAPSDYWIFSNPFVRPDNYSVIVYLSRFQPPNGNPKPKSHITIGPVPLPLGYRNIFDILTAHNIALLVGERYALSLKMWAPDFWPWSFNKGTYTFMYP